jgi:hypothetical protein
MRVQRKWLPSRIFTGWLDTRSLRNGALQFRDRFIVILEDVLCSFSRWPRAVLLGSPSVGLYPLQRSDHRLLIDAQVQVGCRAQVRMPKISCATLMLPVVSSTPCARV